METNKENGLSVTSIWRSPPTGRWRPCTRTAIPASAGGWTPVTPCVQGLTRVTMKFKRDRKIRNKAELTRLQRQFESGAAEIAALEKSKTLGASAAAFLIGIVGTAFMAGSVFSYLAGMLPPMHSAGGSGLRGLDPPHLLLRRPAPAAGRQGRPPHRSAVRDDLRRVRKGQRPAGRLTAAQPP